MGGEQQNASKESPCTLEVKEEVGCPRRRDEGKFDSFSFWEYMDKLA